MKEYFKKAGFVNFINDVRGAIVYLKTINKIHIKKISLINESEYGLMTNGFINL